MSLALETPDTSVRERILVEATRLFAERGVSGTSVQAVASAAGITKPTLIYHFGTKDGLRTEVITVLLDHWRDELPRLMSAAASGPRIDGLIGAMFDFFRRDPARARLLLREMLDRPVEMRELIRAQIQPWTRLLTEALRVGQQQGALREDIDPEAFIVLIISCAVGVVAVGDGTSALQDPSPSVDAQQAELIRIAKTALLCPKEA